MNFFKNLYEQLRSVWRQSGAAGRVGLVAATLLCVAVVVGVGIWSSRPNFVALASNLDPAQSSAIVAKLEAQGIEYKLDFAGSTVLVSSHELSKARLAAGDLIAPDAGGEGDLETSFLEDPSMSEYKLLRKQEASLVRTISKFQGVASATVHLATAEPTPFVREQSPSTASVVLELRPGATFTAQQAAGVQQLVAGAVAGLLPQHVVVSDTRGRVLSIDASAAGSDIASQFELRRGLEAELGAKAEFMLAQMLGPGKALVRVTADIDFTRIKRTETTFDPDQQVKKTEFIKTTSRKGGDAATGGPAGTSSNLTDTPASARSIPVDVNEEESTSEYDTSKSESETDQAGGKVTRLTIAATVDIGEAKRPDGTAITKEDVEALIKHAVGYDDQERQDKITVVTTSLPGMVVEEDPTVADAQQWSRYNEIARNASLGVAGVIAFVLGWLALKRMRPAAPQDDAVARAAERAGRAAELSNRARQRPDAAAEVIAAWLEETEAHTPLRTARAA
jgi:flagellar M-ring protein FliF